MKENDIVIMKQIIKEMLKKAPNKTMILVPIKETKLFKELKAEFSPPHP